MLRRLTRICNIHFWLPRILWLIIGFILLDLIFSLPPVKSFSRIVTAVDGSMLAANLSEDDQWRMKANLKEISPDFITAITQKEDRWFRYHPGVNPVSILRAFWANLTTGKRVSGASTITMQVARMMQRRPRTYINKFIEMFRALQLEVHYSKDEILELYLSYLPYGGNIEGVKAASLIYFERPPQQLSLAQATLLAVIPNRPNSLRLDKSQEEALKVRNKWLQRFQAEQVFSEKDVQIALTEPIIAKRHQLEVKAPHLSRYLLSHYPDTELTSTLDPNIQSTAEQLLSNYVNRVKNKGVSNGAVLVIDNANGAVVAYCGSADFSDDLSAGQVDGIRAVRSPGSALKPAVYATAFDIGRYTPKTILNDIPINFGGYAPENYDYEYHGQVTVEEALRNSLNTTAVRTLNTVGLQSFIDHLIRSGFETIRKQKDGLGLSVILGGCGVTLEELTRFYSGLAYGGKLRNLAYTPTDIERERDTLSIASPEAAWMIAEILSGIERPDIPIDYLTATNKTRIAWKTGTSYGKRDAWSVGFTPRYTIGVWMGNFSGHGAPELSGAVMAVPLLIDLFDGIDRKGNEWFEQPAGVFERKVCIQTGQVPSLHCKMIDTDYFIKNVSSKTPCALDRPLFISPDSIIQYCPECIKGAEYISLTYPSYDPELVLWFDDDDMPYPKPPLHNPNCEALLYGKGPTIISPSADFEYLIEKGAEQEILLHAATDEKASLLYWYVDNEFLKSSLPGERVFFKPTHGNIHIRCMDDKGRESKVEIEVVVF